MFLWIIVSSPTIIPIIKSEVSGSWACIAENEIARIDMNKTLFNY
jgi:hypothetical protein